MLGNSCASLSTTKRHSEVKVFGQTSQQEVFPNFYKTISNLQNNSRKNLQKFNHSSRTLLQTEIVTKCLSSMILWGEADQNLSYSVMTETMKWIANGSKS